jgi:hypothetical protein
MACDHNSGVAVALGDGDAAQRRGEQDPLRTSVERVSLVTAHAASRQVKLVADAADRRHGDVGVEWHHAVRNKGPEQAAVDARVAGVADERAGHGVARPQHPPPQLIGVRLCLPVTQ